jgi:arylsulfatase A-like enzyme
VSPAVLDELRRGGVPIDDYFRYYGDSFLMGTSDIVLAQAAAHAIATRKPALLAIHLLLTDEVQHELGPMHYRAQAALTTADHAVSLLVDAVRKAGIAEQTTFVVTADHGFATIDKQVNLGPLFADPALKGAVTLHPQGWSLFVEKTPAFNAGTHQAALDRAYQRAASITGVATIVRSAEFHALGVPTYDESPFIAGQDMIVGDVDTFLTADADNPSTARVPLTPPRHEHGYLPTHPKMFTSLVLSGRGVRMGATIGHVRSLDVAPTIAALLGIEMKDVEGRVLVVALVP